MRKIDLSKVSEATVGGFKRLPAGGYVIKIAKCEDNPSNSTLKFYFDIAEGEYKNFYSESYKNDTRTPKKWGGTFTKSYDTSKPKALSFLKQFVTAVQNSNKGFVWDEEHEEQFKNKIVGATFREEEYVGNDGKVRTSVKPDMFHSADKIRKGDFEIREPKKLETTVETKASTANIDFNAMFADNTPTAEQNNDAVPNEKDVWGDDDNDLPF